MSLFEKLSTWFAPKKAEAGQSQPVASSRSKSNNPDPRVGVMTSTDGSSFTFTASQKTEQLCEHSSEPGYSGKRPTFLCAGFDRNGRPCVFERDAETKERIR